MMWLRRIFLGMVILGLVANYSWVHAAIVYAGSQSCDPGLVDRAQSRVTQFYGSVESRPWLACLSHPKWGLGEIIGTTHFAPGLPAVIVLNQQGQNVDVLAHEWSHAEFAHRLGVLHRTYLVPTWLDEGLAMQVDLREGYAKPALVELMEQVGAAPELHDIRKPEGFFRSGAQGRLHYAYSRCVVARLLEQMSLSKLMQSTDQLDNARIPDCDRTYLNAD